MYQVNIYIYICIKASYRSITLDELEQIQTFYLEIYIDIHLLNILYISLDIKIFKNCD